MHIHSEKNGKVNETPGMQMKAKSQIKNNSPYQFVDNRKETSVQKEIQRMSSLKSSRSQTTILGAENKVDFKDPVSQLKNALNNDTHTVVSFKEDKSQNSVIQRVKGENRGKKQKKKGRQRGEALVGRGKRRRQEQDSFLAETASKVEAKATQIEEEKAADKRKESYKAHDDRLATAKENRESQEAKHKGSKERNADINSKKRKSAEMREELLGVLDSAQEKAPLYDRIGSTKWGKSQQAERELWYESARPLRRSYLDFDFEGYLSKLLKLSNWNPWLTNDFEEFNSDFDEVIDPFNDVKSIARNYFDKLQEAESKVEAYEPPDPGSAAARRPKELKKEYAYGAANTVPHIHTYGDRFHLKIVDPGRPGEPVRINLVTENGYLKENMDYAIRLANGNTGKPELVGILTRIKAYLES
ncbi:hypothetical protein [Algoriphagus formosus]|uniref:Uncharacterized protein n=1 Tax=Algoriphagus formosus TaxID=2007308 RepID=A0A4R5V7V3_9BACT|nr:hypothetical protein [Algoriphagus aquimaris]TDK47931.1 hypothetical protein E1898_04465 [Algoriphagus aquimaris]